MSLLYGLAIVQESWWLFVLLSYILWWVVRESKNKGEKENLHGSRHALLRVSDSRSVYLYIYVYGVLTKKESDVFFFI